MKKNTLLTLLFTTAIPLLSLAAAHENPSSKVSPECKPLLEQNKSLHERYKRLTREYMDLMKEIRNHYKGMPCGKQHLNALTLPMRIEALSNKTATLRAAFEKVKNGQGNHGVESPSREISLGHSETHFGHTPSH